MTDEDDITRVETILIYAAIILMGIILALAGCAAPGQAAAVRPSIEAGAGSTVTQTSSSLQRTDHSLDAGRVQLGEKWQRLIGQGAACAILALLGLVLLMLILDNPVTNPRWRAAVLLIAVAMLASPAVLLFGVFVR